jgi:tyrosine-protein phosphatase SIW14
MKILASLLLLLFTIAAQGIAEFHQVTAGIYRGGRPASKDLETLQKQQQIKTVLSLEKIAKIVAQEKQLVEKLGMSFVNVPMSVDDAPTDKEMERLLAALNNQSNQPLFIHCLHGQDRTGLAIGLFRFKIQGWTADQAYSEMLENHFHPRYKALDNYFKEKTGRH